MEEYTYWVVRFTSIDGGRQTVRWDKTTTRKFSTKEAADNWAAGMLDWQEPEVVQEWNYR